MVKNSDILIPPDIYLIMLSYIRQSKVEHKTIKEKSQVVNNKTIA